MPSCDDDRKPAHSRGANRPKTPPLKRGSPASKRPHLREARLEARLKNHFNHTSHVTHHTSYVTRHTSHVTRHTSQVTRHTPHVTRHTSHVTRDTSHTTRLASEKIIYGFNTDTPQNRSKGKPCCSLHRREGGGGGQGLQLLMTLRRCSSSTPQQQRVCVHCALKKGRRRRYTSKAFVLRCLRL